MNKLLEAKRILYYELIQIDPEKITDNECEIMFLLSKDEQIKQLFFEKK